MTSTKSSMICKNVFLISNYDSEDIANQYGVKSFSMTYREAESKNANCFSACRHLSIVHPTSSVFLDWFAIRSQGFPLQSTRGRDTSLGVSSAGILVAYVRLISWLFSIKGWYTHKANIHWSLRIFEKAIRLSLRRFSLLWEWTSIDKAIVSTEDMGELLSLLWGKMMSICFHNLPLPTIRL